MKCKNFEILTVKNGFVFARVEIVTGWWLWSKKTSKQVYSHVDENAWHWLDGSGQCHSSIAAQFQRLQDALVVS
jgi:hypothetical protein